MSITMTEASDDSTEELALITPALPGVCFEVALSVGRNLCGVVKSTRCMEVGCLPARDFLDVDGVLKSDRSRLQLSSFSSDSTLLGVL